MKYALVVVFELNFKDDSYNKEYQAIENLKQGKNSSFLRTRC